MSGKITREQEEHYLSLLKEPMAFRHITEDGFDPIIVGEDGLRRTVFLCACGSLVLNRNLASYNVLVNSESGAGKDFVVNNVLKIFPENEMIIKRTRTSPTVFNYWHTSLKEPWWTWDKKVLYLEDCSNAILNSDVFKVMCSSGSHATITINQQAVDLEVKGKPVIIITSASATPKAEMLRRFMNINADESEQQTGAIMDRKADFGVLGKSPKVEEELRDYIEALKFLKPIRVKIPYAKILRLYFPKNHLIMRTHFERFLDLIKASVAFHQYQREKDVEDFYIADGVDYDIARAVILKTTTNASMIPLTKNQQKIIERLKSLPPNITIFDGNEKELGYSAPELEPKISFLSERHLRRELDTLTSLGFLIKSKEERTISRKEVMAYRLVDFVNFEIPTWEELMLKNVISV